MLLHNPLVPLFTMTGKNIYLYMWLSVPGILPIRWEKIFYKSPKLTSLNFIYTHFITWLQVVLKGINLELKIYNWNAHLTYTCASLVLKICILWTITHTNWTKSKVKGCSPSSTSINLLHDPRWWLLWATGAGPQVISTAPSKWPSPAVPGMARNKCSVIQLRKLFN